MPHVLACRPRRRLGRRQCTFADRTGCRPTPTPNRWITANLSTVKKGTIPVVLGLLMLAGSLYALQRATPMMSFFNFAFATVTLLWGVTDKLVARLPAD